MITIAQLCQECLRCADRAAGIVQKRARIVHERARVTRSVSGALTHKLLIRLGLGDSDP